MSTPRIVRCPTCDASVEWTPQSKWRPFCSERCKLVDLGAWATGSYRIPTPEKDDDEPGAAADER